MKNTREVGREREGEGGVAEGEIKFEIQIGTTNEEEN